MTNSSEYDAGYETAIAIIGMSGRFPGAPDVQTFWRNLAGGVKSIRFFSQQELEAAGVERSLLEHPNYVKAGATLDGIDLFDAPFFGLSPREAELMDPQHRLFLECAWEALEDAAYDPGTYRGLVGVFGGTGFSSYLMYNLYLNPEIMDWVDPFQASVVNDKDSLASTVSYKLNLRGPSLTVQTFCSTSLVAVHLACQSLLNYECDVVLAGGAAIAVPHVSGYVYKEGGIVSPDGACRTFDAKAQGSVLGNGVGVVTLKRLVEARHDGDHIYAVIRGSAINNDGSLRVSYTAPGLQGQSEVIAEALGHAGVSAESISYIEAHGTATPLGDAVELAAMKHAFAAQTDRQQFCAIGSVKPNVGHLDRASGVTGLIKTTLALQHRLVPPSLNFEQASAEVGLETSPFYVNTQLSEWQSDGRPRRAGVSSFGLGGTNAHVVLEEAPAAERGSQSRPWQLLLLSARSETALQAASTRLATHLKEHADLDLADVAYTLQVGRSAFNYRQVLLCRDRAEAMKALQAANPTQTLCMHQTHRDREVAFLFPGVGEQYDEMARELYEQEPTFREGVDQCCSILEARVGLNLHEALFPTEPQARGSKRNGAANSRMDLRALLGRSSQNPSPSPGRLKDTAIAQPAVFVIEYALAQLLQEWGIRPQAMLGYSLGEYVAACLAGVLSLEDALTLVARRAQLIAEVPEGAMLAVALSQDAVELFLDEQICLAAVTGQNTCVLAGPVEAIEQLEVRLNEQEIVTRRVETTHAFHSSMLEPLRKPVQALVSSVTLNEPQIPYISNVTGTWITAEQATDPMYWATHMCQTVRFVEGVGHLLEEQERVLVEVGPGQSLSAYARQHPACGNERLSFVVPTLPSVYERQSEHASLLTALGKLWLAGVTPDWTGFYAREHRRRVSLPTYPFERQRYWIEPPRTGLHEKPTPHISRDKKPDVADWFYRPTWEQAPLLSVQQEVTPGTGLVFIDTLGVGTQMVKRLTQQGSTCICVQPGNVFAQLDEQHFTLRPGEAADYQALCKALSNMVPKIILHCWSLTQQDRMLDNPAHFKAMQDRGFYSLLFLAQALGAQMYADPVRIVALSNHMQAVTECETVHPEKATILGACKVIPQEHLNMTCRCIDIAVPASRTLTDAQLIDRIMAECTTSSSDHVVAYRGGTRWVERYEPVRLEAGLTDAPVLRQHGVYLITGGLGKVGLLLARYLAESVQARLVLLARSALPPRQDWQEWLSSHSASEPTSQLIQQLEALEQLGSQVLVLSADVSHRQQMQAALEQTLARFGDLHGVIHAAGISQEAAFRPVQESGRELCEWHFEPKVYGTYVLEEVLAGRRYDFCLLCSSLSAILGGLGFVGYTAANSFLDAYVLRHNQGSDVSWSSVNWDSWQVKENAHGLLGGTIAAYTMQPEEGVEAFRRVVASGMSRVINSTGDLQPRLQQWLHFQPLHESRETEHPPSTATRPNLSNPYVAPSNEHEQKIAGVWQQVLGIEQVGLYDNFFDLGGHSLIGTQLISRLRQIFQLNLPLAMLFEAPTVAELALAIKMLLIEEIDKLDEEEVKSLI